MITGTDVTVWTISGLLAIGIGWSAYAKRKTRDKLVRELAAMEPDRREKVLQRLNPKLAMEMREQLMERFQIMSWRAPEWSRVTEARLTAAILPAIAFLVIVHGAVLAGLLAALRLCRKTSTANRCRQNRKQNFGVIFHSDNFARSEKWRQRKNHYRAVALLELLVH
jgi:hypothetical protein